MSMSNITCSSTTASSLTNKINDADNTSANMSKLLRQDLDFVEQSIEAAKRSIDLLIVQIKEARMKFSELLMGRTLVQGIEKDVLFQELKTEVSSLKFKIPFNLINSTNSQQLSHPHINRRPRSNPRSLAKSLPPDGGRSMQTIPSLLIQELDLTARSFNPLSVSCLRCFLAFPGNTIVKRSLIFGLVNIMVGEEQAHEAVKRCLATGLVNPVYKKNNLTICGYWMHPFVHSHLSTKHELRNQVDDDLIYISECVDEDDVFYDDPKQFYRKKLLEILHLGNWQRSTLNHIEVTDQDLFFQNMWRTNKLRYVSFRRVSMIEELPKFVSSLRFLETLDLKACHQLEVIPSDIANLGHCLTHLDMSECYFLDHMPKALAKLQKLKVLKGFFIGKTNKEEETCTLMDLIHFESLRKLNIYTDVEEFPNSKELHILAEIRTLRNLTISWGGCSIPKVTLESSQAKADADFKDRVFRFRLQKLDLQCVPRTINRRWLKPVNFKNLDKLYIRGGQFYDLGQLQNDKMDKETIALGLHQWYVKILCLKYLDKLKLGWTDIEDLFPDLVYLEKVECPKLTSFPCDESGVWTNDAKPLPTMYL